MTISRLGWISASLVLSLVVTGCTTGASKDLPPAERVPSLVVPPDLTVPKGGTEFSVPDAVPGGTATYSGYAGGASSAATVPLLTAPGDLRIERAGGQRWLVAAGTAETLWPALKQFLQKNHLALARENPATGILETEWTPGALDRKTLGSDAPGTRDQYRLRLERGSAPNTTEIYLSHHGVVQIGCDKNNLWQLRPPEPEMEAEMLRRLMLFLGAQEAQAKAQLSADAGKAGGNGKPRAQLVGTEHGTGMVRLASDMDTAWRRTGLAIEHVGFVVEDRDRTKGLYYVRASDAVKQATQVKKGFFSWFGGGKSAPAAERYQIGLVSPSTGDKEPVTDVQVLDAAGAPDTSAVGKRIVELLFEQLK
jgi:outer membrane protein assembly factor BamC